MKVAINKQNGILICELLNESGAISAAVERGYLESEIEVREVNDSEYFDLQIARNIFSKTGKAELVQARINFLEQQQLLPRITREALMENLIYLASTQGITEPQMYAVNIGYRKTKDFDAQIALLRAML